jgi:hypothetical protein
MYPHVRQLTTRWPAQDHESRPPTAIPAIPADRKGGSDTPDRPARDTA